MAGDAGGGIETDGSGTNREIGFLDSDPGGVIEFAVPLQAVFALTTTPLGQLPW